VWDTRIPEEERALLYATMRQPSPPAKPEDRRFA